MKDAKARGKDEATGGETRERILQAATRLFAAGGIAGTSLLNIADAAGISRGTLFYHYRAKEELVCDVADRHMARLSERLLALAESQGSVPAMLELLVSRITEDTERSRMHYFLIHEILDGNETIRRRMAANYASWTETIAAQCAKVSGLAADGTAAAIAIAMLDGLIIRGALDIPTPSVRESALAMEAVFARQVGAAAVGGKEAR